MSETMDWDEDDDPDVRPYGGRPYGGRPYGGRPSGGRPYGGQPYGGRPYGGKPYGGKPYGGRPIGQHGDPGGFLDLDEWSADIGELVCERSAVIRQGATLFAGDELELPALAPARDQAVAAAIPVASVVPE